MLDPISQELYSPPDAQPPGDWARPHRLGRHLLVGPDSPPPCHTNSRRLSGPSTVAPATPTAAWPGEKHDPPGQAMLPSAEGRGTADGSFFTSCWCFGESLPLRTAGPTAAVSEGCSEAGPGSREREGGAHSQFRGHSVSPASGKLLFFHFY